MFLYSHCVELFLKEYLRLKGYREKKPWGHDLKRLWAAAKAQGIALAQPHQFDTLIINLASGHEDYQFRYSEKSFSHSGPNWTRRDVGSLAAAVSSERELVRRAASDKLEKDGVTYYSPLANIFVSVDLDNTPKPTN